MARDYPVIFGTLFFFGLMGLLMGHLSDLMYVWIDPRIDFERRGLMRAFAPEPAALAQLPREPARLLVAVLFVVLFGLSLFAEVLANDKPLLVRYKGEFFTPIFRFYPETAFGGDFQTEAVYRDPEVQCLIVAGGSEACWDDPEGIMAEARASGTAAGEPVQTGWMLWPLIPFSYNTIERHRRAPRPRPPTARTGWAPTTPRATCWRG